MKLGWYPRVSRKLGIHIPGHCRPATSASTSAAAHPRFGAARRRRPDDRFWHPFTLGEPGLDRPADAYRPEGPEAQGLYRPADEHDACGVAFVVDVQGRRSHATVEQGLSALCRMEHRGAQGAEPNTGDGAGILVQVPDAFLRATVKFPLPEAGRYATGLVFLPADEGDATWAGQIIEKYVTAEGARLLGWRDVPTEAGDLGATARA